ncbi:MAG: hypothetical protein R3264_19290, partial [Anaerolineae bacterium]|nr:hypothetical protein [Anaerolineae bacterium]
MGCVWGGWQADRIGRERLVNLAMAASNERAADRLLSTYRVVFRIAAKMRDAGVTLDQIDVGGGLGVPYAPDESP